MRAIGRVRVGSGACVAALLALLTIPIGLSHAEEPAPSASACPPSPTVLSGSAPPTPSTAPPTVLSGSAPPTPSITPHSTSPYRPSAEEVVACVRSQEITGATFAHWAAVAGNAEPHRRPAAEPTHKEMTQVMGFLISADWILGEAAKLHINLSSVAVRRQFDKLRREQFPKDAQFKAFLRQTGQTSADILLRVRLSMLSTRIQQQIVGHGSVHTRQHRLSRFAKQFEDRWVAQTYCESLYTMADCGHTASSL